MILCWFFVSVTFLVKIFAENPPSCKTPNGEDALCVSLFSCSILQEVIASKDPSVQKFFEESSCGNLKVCCGTVGNFTEPLEEAKPTNVREEGRLPMESKRDYVIRKLLPTEKYCGLQHSDDYPYKGNDTSVYDFPWLVYISLIKYSQHAGGPDIPIEVRVAGVIINKRYVLTTSQYGTINNAKAVRIGQYHRFKDSDCIGKDELFGSDCTEDALELGVAEKFSRENLVLIRLNDTLFYTESRMTGRENMAMKRQVLSTEEKVKVVREIENDFIRPICLPLDESKRAKPDDLVVISGWGDLGFEAEKVLVKKRLNHTLVENEDCKKKYVGSTSPTCAKAQNNKEFACLGDEGGPLMYKPKFSWFVEGIIVEIPEPCKGEVYGERLTQEILNWMFEHMYP